MNLKGRTAIVTGSGRGIGRAIALAFARRGASVVVCARREEDIRETQAIIEKAGGKALAVPCDVGDRKSVGELVEKTLAAYGKIDVLFNNAASFWSIGPLWEADPDVWWKDVTINLLGPMLCCKAVLPHMIKNNEGVVINMNGGGALVPLVGGSGYGSSKAALMRLTEGLAKELEKVGAKVWVFGLGPGLVRTETTERQMMTNEGRKWIPSTAEVIEAGKSRPPEDAAQAAVSLVRVAGRELNGRIFDVGMDFDKLRHKAIQIKNKDLLVMRLRPAQ